MHIDSTLVWAEKGEPFREAVVLSDERTGAVGRGLAVLNRNGKLLALQPDDLPRDSVLLVPPKLSEADFEEIERSGYKARRSAYVMLGPDASMSHSIRVMAEILPFMVIQGNAARNLLAELGGPESAARWLVDLAEEVDRPVGINLPQGEETWTMLVAPSSWSQERLNAWMVGYEDELQEAFGGLRRIQTPNGDLEIASSFPPPDADEREQAVAAAEAELAEVARRLASELERSHPELFDAEGQLRPGEYSRAALELSRGKRLLTREEILRMGKERKGLEDEAGPLDGS